MKLHSKRGLENTYSEPRNYKFLLNYHTSLSVPYTSYTAQESVLQQTHIPYYVCIRSSQSLLHSFQGGKCKHNFTSKKDKNKKKIAQKSSTPSILKTIKTHFRYIARTNVTPIFMTWDFFRTFYTYVAPPTFPTRLVFSAKIDRKSAQKIGLMSHFESELWSQLKESE